MRGERGEMREKADLDLSRWSSIFFLNPWSPTDSHVWRNEWGKWGKAKFSLYQNSSQIFSDMKRWCACFFWSLVFRMWRMQVLRRELSGVYKLHWMREKLLGSWLFLCKLTRGCERLRYSGMEIVWRRVNRCGQWWCGSVVQVLGCRCKYSHPGSRGLSHITRK